MKKQDWYVLIHHKGFKMLSSLFCSTLNSEIEEFVISFFWCHEQVIKWSGYLTKFLSSFLANSTKSSPKNESKPIVEEGIVEETAENTKGKYLPQNL